MILPIAANKNFANSAINDSQNLEKKQSAKSKLLT
jgi:hypothetical protein